MIDRMNKVIDELAPVLKSLDWSNPKVYAWWLSQAFCIARQSTSFLGLTMIHSKAYPAFLERCTDHISEETGHEKLIMNDLKALGIEMLPELPATSAIYQTQYYRIRRIHFPT
ncbi:MAG: hypothetical protein EOP06_29320 [Proteobacteria bacterium]|nr:MAG: hypothetical protein EOP06_29320 [Pseudomonadota bacterium]